MKHTLMLVVGEYGGFHFSPGHLCLGYVSVTYLPIDIELQLAEMVMREEKLLSALVKAHEGNMAGICILTHTPDGVKRAPVSYQVMKAGEDAVNALRKEGLTI